MDHILVIPAQQTIDHHFQAFFWFVLHLHKGNEIVVIRKLRCVRAGDAIAIRLCAVDTYREFAGMFLADKICSDSGNCFFVASEDRLSSILSLLECAFALRSLEEHNCKEGKNKNRSC